MVYKPLLPMEPIKHLFHPEDTILTGDLSVFDDLYGRSSHISLKMDGSPAIVWGTYRDKFFVSTKSAFNKKKIKLCYTPEDIDFHFGNQWDLADILYLCLKYLPRVEGVYQGDFLGFGNKKVLKNNTLAYHFNDTIQQNIVVAPHTRYYVDGALSEAVPLPLRENFTDTKRVKFVMPSVDRIPSNLSAPIINTETVKFLTEKESNQAKISINAIIKSGQELDDETLTDILGCPNLANLYQYVIEIKEDMIDNMIVYSDFKTYLPNDEETVGEGFVFWTEAGAFKLVKRNEFSHFNFTQGKFQ